MEEEKGSYIRFSRRHPLDQGQTGGITEHKTRQDLGGTGKTSAERAASPEELVKI